MRDEAIFINGVYESVLEEARNVQSLLPEQILYLQPYSGGAIAHLREDPPSAADPVRLYASITTDLSRVHYMAEIVGWEDKRELSHEKHVLLTRIIVALQPGETGLYDAAEADSPSVNLLYIRRLQRLDEPFGVENLIKTIDGTPVSPGRATAGGWAYVENQHPPAA